MKPGRRIKCSCVPIDFASKSKIDRPLKSLRDAASRAFDPIPVFVSPTGTVWRGAMLKQRRSSC
jgi:hypothetical protein